MWIHNYLHDNFDTQDEELNTDASAHMKSIRCYFVVALSVWRMDTGSSLGLDGHQPSSESVLDSME